MQVAGIRTDANLEEIGEPLSLYCRLSDDILPHPQACLITGISPQLLQDEGLCEAEFFTRLHGELAHPGTCTAGYNNRRFDDEVTRYGLYRNFFDPYAREWQGGNSRWDLIDMVRACYALRPEGLQWPELDGTVTLKLEHMTRANGIDHGQAHEALSDVRATIAMARLIRRQQPKLYHYLYGLRRKQEVMRRIRLLEPIVHVSGMFGAERRYATVVLPLARHPVNQNAFIACDLLADLSPLQDCTAEELRERLFTPRNELAVGQVPVPLKLIHANRCPVVAPLGVLRPEDQKRLQWSLDDCVSKAEQLRGQSGQWLEKVVHCYQRESMTKVAVDAELALYEGVLENADRRRCDAVRAASTARLASADWHFDDERMNTLLFRYRARNHRDSLTGDEKRHWFDFCHHRLFSEDSDAPLTLDAFEEVTKALSPTVSGDRQALLRQWQNYAADIGRCYKTPLL